MIGLGSRTQLGIGIAVYLEDKFSTNAKKLNDTLKTLHKGSLSYVDKAARDMRNSSAVISAAAGGATLALAGATRQGAKFQHTIRQIAIQGGKDMKLTEGQLTSLAERMAKDFGQKPEAVAEALLENVRAGVRGSLDEITRYQMKLAASSGEALEGVQGVAAGTLSVMNMYGMEAEKMYNVGGKQIKGISYVANVLQAAANKSQASVYSLNESFQYMGATASRVNMTLEESAALIAQMSMGGIRGSAAGTGLNNMITQLTKNVGELAGPKKKWALAQLGLSSQYAIDKINAGKTYELLQDIAAMSSKLDLHTRLAVGNELFNIRGDKAAGAAFTDFVKGVVKSRSDLSVEKLRKEIIESVKQDVVTQQSNKMLDDLWTDINQMIAGLDNLKNAFVRTAGPILRTLVQFATKVTGWVTAFLETPLGSVLASIVAVTAPLVTVFFAFRAAAITAAFALRTMANAAIANATAQGVNTRQSWFNTLSGGVLGGGFKTGGAGAFSKAMAAGTLVQNANGAWRVAKGQTFSIGGKVYKGGQMIPRGLAGMASGAAGQISMMGRAGSWLGKIGSFTGRWLPLLGTLLLVKDILGSILGETIKNREENGTLVKHEDWQREMFQNMINTPNMRPTAYNPYAKSNWPTNNITVNIDGVKQSADKINEVQADQSNTQINFKFKPY